MEIVLMILKFITMIFLTLVAATIGMFLGALFGTFMGPIKLYEFMNNNNEDNINSDAI